MILLHPITGQVCLTMYIGVTELCGIISQLEDNLAQAFCLLGELQHAKSHCKASMQVSFKRTFSCHFILEQSSIPQMLKSKTVSNRVATS